MQTNKNGSKVVLSKKQNKNLQKFLTSEGIDVDFETCINNKEIEDFVLNDRIDGVKNFNVNATPYDNNQ